MNEVTRDEKKARLLEKKESRAVYHSMGHLKADSGWRKLVSIMEKMIKSIEQEALYSNDIDERRRAVLSGQAEGMRIMCQLPETLYEQAREISQDDDQEEN